VQALANLQSFRFSRPVLDALSPKIKTSPIDTKTPTAATAGGKSTPPSAAATTVETKEPVDAVLKVLEQFVEKKAGASPLRRVLSKAHSIGNMAVALVSFNTRSCVGHFPAYMYALKVLLLPYSPLW
jgi:hypothetical protein